LKEKNKIMIRSVLIPFGLVILFIVSLTGCDSITGKDVEKSKQDSIKSISKRDSLKIASELNKYSIQPPDADYTGDYIDKYENGVIKFTGFFRFGLRHGQWMAFYDNGIKWSECFYDKGKKQGATMVFHPNGQLKYSGWYKQDQKDSIWFWYDEKGKEVDRHAFRMGEETGLVN
jgi:antitoxin component YwqK of YwqJK toxin-antitoxin module